MYDGNAKYGLPTEEQVANLRALVLADSTPGAEAAAAHLPGLPDWDAVRSAWDSALSKIDVDPDGAITAARTTLESVCKHILDERDMQDAPAWDLSPLLKATTTALGFAPAQPSEPVFRQILSGIGTVVDGLAGLRNAL